MSSYKKADHRLVQPRPEHYIEITREDGKTEQRLVGPYTLQQRDDYFKTMISLHQTRHPKIPHKIARQAVNHKWRMLVFATIGDEFVPVKNPKKSKDAIKKFK
jgi:hypothetical protein